MQTLLAFLEWGPWVGAVVLGLIIARWIMAREEARLSGHRFRNQVTMMFLLATGLLVIILVVPMENDTQGQVLQLIGILLSAAIALSSTTVLGNAMAGLMMRGVRNFRMGDFIRAGEHFGRVSERGLFHTEIQTESRELTTIPNLYLVTHPVTTTRSSGTIVSTLVSLGYDVPRTRVEELLLDAAAKADLSDPFVHIVELGDFSVSYRISGLLADVKRLLTARSTLRKRVLDSLHEGNVEIVSPTFMNTRALSADALVIPKRPAPTAELAPEPSPEDVVFDKAEEAESLENLHENLAAVLEEIVAAEAGLKELPEGEEREAAERELSKLQRRKERLESAIAGHESKVAGS